MISKIFLIIGILLMVLGACTPAQLPIIITSTLSSIPTPLSPSLTPTYTPSIPPTAPNISISTPPSVPVESSPNLIHIDFQDAANGWGVSTTGSGSIVRTVDAGITWQNVTPLDLNGIGYSTSLFGLNANKAWVLVPNVDFFKGRLYQTMDGGLTWSFFEAPFGGGSIQFLDANIGRVLADRGAGAGSQSVEMFQTSDGGATWMSVFNNDPTRPDSSNSLPLSGIKNGMTFLDSNTGWVTGTRPVDGEVYVFVTQDGGIDWLMQNISLPADYESYQYMAQAPVFFGNDGFLPLIIFLSNTSVMTFFTTHDGGKTWSGDPSNSSQIVVPCHYAFADALHGWCWDGGTTLYLTSDGSQTWNSTPASLDLSGHLAQIEFVPGTTDGFTGWVLSSGDNGGPTMLYKTIDNGTSWTPLIP
jgi:photosystem II stability/assembly factor-like uncharacterized protein